VLFGASFTSKINRTPIHFYCLYVLIVIDTGGFMDLKLDIQTALQAFFKITQHGEKIGDDYVLDGIRANSSIDGYTVTLKDNNVEVSIFFHNKYSVETGSRGHFNQFLDTLSLINKKDYE